MNPTRLSGRALTFLCAALALLFAGCSTPFPRPDASATASRPADAHAIFDRCLAAHGGDVREHATDINLSMDGEWGFLIQRIQPVVTDTAYRIRAEERYRPTEQLYSVRWEGPSGVKTVVRTPETVEVFYNGARNTDEETLQAAAMTSDAFQLFHLGPSFLKMRNATFTQLDDARERGVVYHRLHTTIRPGFGFSESDEVVLWIHPESHRLFRVHMTLNGVETTQGAHVDTTFLGYRQVGKMLVPTELNERVRGPLRIQAHRWWMTGADLDRGWSADDVRRADFMARAAEPARSLPSR